jgi:hypothetical protein
LIFPPTEKDVQAFLARCVLNGDVRDVRKLNAARDDAEVEEANRERLRVAKQQSRARLK